VNLKRRKLKIASTRLTKWGNFPRSRQRFLKDEIHTNPSSVSPNTNWKDGIVGNVETGNDRGRLLLLLSSDGRGWGRFECYVRHRMGRKYSKTP